MTFKYIYKISDFNLGYTFVVYNGNGYYIDQIYHIDWFNKLLQGDGFGINKTMWNNKIYLDIFIYNGNHSLEDNFNKMLDQFYPDHDK